MIFFNFKINLNLKFKLNHINSSMKMSEIHKVLIYCVVRLIKKFSLFQDFRVLTDFDKI
jgi:hypothetical protein